MVQKNITSEDVAKLAKVSQSAVSRTFTPGASVSDKTRAKVLAAAKTLSYRPIESPVVYRRVFSRIVKSALLLVRWSQV